YKNEERLQWERDYDCNVKFREWILENNFETEENLQEMEKSIKKQVLEAKKAAWTAYVNPTKNAQQELLQVLNKIADKSSNKTFILNLTKELSEIKDPLRKDLLVTARKVLRYILNDDSSLKNELRNWINTFIENVQPFYSSHLYSQSKYSALNIEAVEPTYNEDAEEVDGRLVLRENFDQIFGNRPETLIFGEDSGEIGDVNQGLEGLQEKYGALRVADVGIREATILGQGIGMAMRGLRPIAEIQYLDYILYALQIMSDDLATLQYRTAGRQKAPLIVRTRGHRLEGIWHSGSQMGGLLHLIRGIHILVPRNMTKAAGFYNTLLESDDPAVIIECLNGYRLKEKLPNNIGEFRTPIGVVETVKEGTDITLVSYGSTLRIVEQAAKELLEVGINAEVIDVQSLLPFDLNHDIVKSVQKTNRLLVIDEDVPGGASAYILQKILEEQNAWVYLDSKPQTLAAKNHRPAYGTDGDYFSKPSVEDVYEKVYAIMHEANPERLPALR
ncbi:MAG TPA: transketolase C-terminal domain-containing protein, partial [Salinimicrobium sp.]|nr:transketolase C-terminal domain-containing protein [Salinimicrobium sp.]